MLRKKISFGLLLALFAALTVQAQTGTPRVTQRQVKQTQRIQQGVASGELTRVETRRLAKQQRRIQRSKRRAKADGDVTARERAALHARQNAASRNVRRKKNN
jgi:Na+-translocating ferredoxin:NAD+ oxidoreductase RnfG subunit